MQRVARADHGNDARVWQAVLSGWCASLVGIGLARFAYTPLLPALIAEQWFQPSQAAYLGAANLAGYLAGGAIFTGVGLGIAASGTLVPPLLRLGLATTWCGLGALALLLTVLAWRGWPDARAATRAATSVPPAAAKDRARRPAMPLKALYVEYGLGAVGLVPHMVFLVDFVARGLGRGLDAGAGYWVLFGLAATLGPVLAGRLADRIGFGPALRFAFLVQAAAVALLVFADGAGGLALSSVVIGAFVPGVVPLVLGRVQELAGPDEGNRTAAWSVATVAFAVGQAAAAYGFSFLFARSGSYTILFALGAAALILAVVIDLAASRATSPRSAAV